MYITESLTKATPNQNAYTDAFCRHAVKLFFLSLSLSLDLNFRRKATATYNPPSDTREAS